MFVQQNNNNNNNSNKLLQNISNDLIDFEDMLEKDEKVVAENNDTIVNVSNLLYYMYLSYFSNNLNYKTLKLDLS